MKLVSLARSMLAMALLAALTFAQDPARCPIQRAELFAPHPMPSDRFGSSVAFDGSTLVVGLDATTTVG